MEHAQNDQSTYTMYTVNQKINQSVNHLGWGFTSNKINAAAILQSLIELL